MQSYLVISRNSVFINEEIGKRKKQLSVSPSNYMEIIPSPSIGIAEIRKMIAMLSLKPYGEGYRLVVIKEMEKATVEAGNALLKLLEEPPPDTCIILCADNLNKLLPTVISRCQIISDYNDLGVGNLDTDKTIRLIKNVLFSSSGNRLFLSVNLAKSKEETLELLKSIIFVLERKIREPVNELNLTRSDLASLIEKTIAAVKYIEKNVNYKAVLDILLLGFPHPPSS